MESDRPGASRRGRVARRSPYHYAAAGAPPAPPGAAPDEAQVRRGGGWEGRDPSSPSASPAAAAAAAAARSVPRSLWGPGRKAAAAAQQQRHLQPQTHPLLAARRPDRPSPVPPAPGQLARAVLADVTTRVRDAVAYLGLDGIVEIEDGGGGLVGFGGGAASASTRAEISRLYRRVLVAVPLLLAVAYGGGGAARRVRGMLDRSTRPGGWRWSEERRRLDGRRCVMNMYIEKQPPDEFNPDLHIGKAGENATALPPPPAIVEGTYRTEGQVLVITRFLEAVADSFRSNINVRQHVIFAGCRDSGHLAELATARWPPRGSHRTQFHVIADDLAPDDSERALGYGTLDGIEERFRNFRGSEHVHLYDREGNVAGGKAGGGTDDLIYKDDDDGAGGGGGTDDDYREGYLDRRFRLDRRRMEEQALSGNFTYDRGPYMNLAAILPVAEGGGSGGGGGGGAPTVVPYLHVDGIEMEEQLAILESARPLLLASTIVAVGVENSPDLDPWALLEFFRSVNYKTFMLGKAQLWRIDSLCPEILEDVLLHPHLHNSTLQPSPLRALLHRWGLLRDDLAYLKDLGGGSAVSSPPFFVAMPRGRRSREEMTIHHMYDLFGGFGGGGGQVLTANDRKVPAKKK